MAIKFQFNKTSLQVLNKSLKMRLMALPIIKNKESALRSEVKKTKELFLDSQQAEKVKIGEIERFLPFWDQFDFDWVKIKDISLEEKKIAGVRIPVLNDVAFNDPEIFFFNHSVWVSEAILVLREVVRLQIETRVLEVQLQILERERKRTTQKVNLYEKVQIPEIETGIKKIKRFLEDEENLSKAAQKMVKSRKVA